MFDRILTPAELLDIYEAAIISKTTETKIELARRLDEDRLAKIAEAEKFRLAKIAEAAAEAAKTKKLLELSAAGKLYQSIGGTWTAV